MSRSSVVRATVLSYVRRRAVVCVAGDEATVRVAHRVKNRVAAAAIDHEEVDLIFDERTIVGIEPV